MSVKDPVHLIFGFVEIKGENGFAERFINLCTAGEIPLWDIHRKGSTVTARTSAAGYRKIRSPARESSMRVRIVRKHGLPFLINKAFRHTGILIGFAVMILILSILTGRIWIIEADNETSIPTDTIISAYEDIGLRVGASKRIDRNILRSDISAKLSDTSWTTVNIIGSTATVKVREVKKTPQIDSGSGTSNIIAIKDGQVEIIEPYRGSAAVKAGQTVTRGGLLVSGVTESKSQISIFSDADGYVVAATTVKVSEDNKRHIPVLQQKRRTVYSLYFLGREIPLGKKSSSDCTYRHRKWLYVGGKKMPFGIYSTVYTDFTESEAELAEQENLLTAVNDYSLKAYHSTLHTQNISKDVRIEKSGDGVTVSGIYRCYENIGMKVPFEVAEIPAE